MEKNQETKEKICSFYASDYHFEMMSLPYINKNLDENKEIIILTENNLENTIRKLINKTNFKEEKKKKIYKIDWKDDNLNKIKKIKEEIKNKKDLIIFIKGTENYIKNTNKEIEKHIEGNNNIKIIDCYNIEEVAKSMDEIVEKYSKSLGTVGERKIEKI